MRFVVGCGVGRGFGKRMDSEVLVFCGESDGVQQPDSFRCCPLGLQFYSPKELPSYKVLELNLRMPDGTGPAELQCSGVVVHSQFEDERSMYRVWVAFLDLPDEQRKQLHCVAECANTLCPHCENF